MNVLLPSENALVDSFGSNRKFGTDAERLRKIYIHGEKGYWPLWNFYPNYLILTHNSRDPVKAGSLIKQVKSDEK